MRGNFAIIGAGQLGSRHLQGLKQSILSSNIWVVDSSVESLKIARSRYEEGGANHNQKVYYLTHMEDLPTELDIVIVATSSLPRLNILKTLFVSCNVKYLILEKFLFPRLSDYAEAEHLFSLSKTKVWVNCPRRMFEYYDRVYEFLNKSEPISMLFEGINWGLCCNAIHFIDIFMKLSKQSSYQLDISGLRPMIYESKRVGYIELMGTINCITSNNSMLSLICKDLDASGDIIIKQGGHIITINEQMGIMSIDGVLEHISIKFQSQLTGIIVDSLMEKGECLLTDYSDSSYYHKTFLSSILKFVNKIQGTNCDVCPIT